MHALREKNSVAWEKDESSLHDRFPAAYLIWPYKGYRFEGFETGQGALKEKLEERIAEFREMRGCAESLMDGGSAPRSSKGPRLPARDWVR